jgi:hypothetical protein
MKKRRGGHAGDRCCPSDSGHHRFSSVSDIFDFDHPTSADSTSHSAWRRSSRRHASLARRAIFVSVDRFRLVAKTPVSF